MSSDPSLHTETVTYQQDGVTLQGFLAYDQAVAGARPGVLVFPEWWGVNDYIQRRTRMLAELGYTVLAADMYGDGRLAADADDAGALMNAVLDDMESGTVRIHAAYRCLVDQPQVDPARVAAIGYCFGGAMALHAARIGMDLRAAVSFHGALGSFHRPAPGEVKAKVLACHGAEDAMVSDQDVAAFKTEMAAAGVDLRFVAYDGALHGFTSREASDNADKYGLPIGYDAEADAASWDEMRAFLSAAFA